MMGQIQAVGIKDPNGARLNILEKKDEIIKRANEVDPILVKFGGGAKDVEVRVIDTPQGKMVITHLVVDCRDAMGANAVNTMAETVAPYIEELTGGRVYLRIISNFADKRLMRAKAVFPKEAIGGEEVVDGIIAAYHFATGDPYRAATHNKGIMNGVSAAVLATGNDTRAIEAGAHVYASRSGIYRPLSCYEKNANGNLVATIEMPMAVGLVGGNKPDSTRCCKDPWCKVSYRNGGGICSAWPGPEFCSAACACHRRYPERPYGASFKEYSDPGRRLRRSG
jgi:hydroxymethylglutaryl-CoA reductase